jgi:hypothetical protein
MSKPAYKDDELAELEAPLVESIHSEEEFPVGFDWIVEHTGFTKKDAALRHLAKLSKDDYTESTPAAPSGRGGGNRKIFSVSLKGFKQMLRGMKGIRAVQVRSLLFQLLKAAGIDSDDAPSAASAGDAPAVNPTVAKPALALTDAEKAEMEPILQGIAHSTLKYPVNFDIVWKYLLYSTKGSAMRALELPELKIELKKEKGVFNREVKKANSEEAKIGRPNETIMMTVDGFKLFAMLARTTRGSQVRQYYLSLEKQVHALKRSIDDGDVELVQTSRKRARTEAAEDREDALAEMEFQEAKRKHQLATMNHHQVVLDNYRKALGHLDAREEIVMRDLATRYLTPGVILTGQAGGGTLAIAGGSEGAEPPKQISIQTVCAEIGKKIPDGKASAIGKVMAALYSARYNKAPPKRRVIFKNRPIDENAYWEVDTDLMTQAINKVLG